MKRCIELSRNSIIKDGTPFAAIITLGGSIVCEATNASRENKTDHAEILVLKKANYTLKSHDLSECTIYTNCEPCPMCSFMIREFRIKRVVFALRSPYMGGYSKWNILEDRDLTYFDSVFGPPPAITEGICKAEASKIFDEVGWTIHT